LDGGSLRANLSATRADAKRATRLMAQVAEALVYLHNCGRTDLDTRPDNIYLASVSLDCAKLSYFPMHVERAADAQSYQAPEIREHTDKARAAVPAAAAGVRDIPTAQRADVFAFGVTAIEMSVSLSASAVRDQACGTVESRAALEATLSQSGLSADVCALLLRCLAAEPIERPTASDLYETLSRAE
jgi:serine/threonine protein kinase